MSCWSSIRIPRNLKIKDKEKETVPRALDLTDVELTWTMMTTVRHEPQKCWSV